MRQSKKRVTNYVEQIWGKLDQEVNIMVTNGESSLNNLLYIKKSSKSGPSDKKEFKTKFSKLIFIKIILRYIPCFNLRQFKLK